VKEFEAFENVSALLYVPLNTADGTVPLARLLAFREVRAEPFPECVPVKEFEAFENVFAPVMDCVVVRSTYVPDKPGRSAATSARREAVPLEPLGVATT
jgi:hypothetical protein